MKILKLVKLSDNDYRAIFDEIPEITYEKIGNDYVGSATDEEGNIIFSDFLRYERASFGFQAFGGRELTLTMKDGSIEKIKDNWWEHGSYPPHGKFIDIGAGTLEDMQRCFVFSSMNISKKYFAKLLEGYYVKDRYYGYDETERWCNLQYHWFPLIINGKEYPFMMNKHGELVERESKKRAYYGLNSFYIKKDKKTGKEFTVRKFDLQYNNGRRLVKIQRNLREVIEETLGAYLTKERINKIVQKGRC